MLKKNHVDEQCVARRSVKDLPEKITRLNKRLSSLTADQSTVTAHARDPVTISTREYAKDEAIAALGAQLDRLPRDVREEQRFPIGTYRGLRFGLVLNRDCPPDVYMEGATTRNDRLIRGSHGPRAVLNALERLCNSCGSEIAGVRQDLAIAESQLRDYQDRIGKSFIHET